MILSPNEFTCKNAGLLPLISKCWSLHSLLRISKDKDEYIKIIRIIKGHVCILVTYCAFRTSANRQRLINRVLMVKRNVNWIMSSYN